METILVSFPCFQWVFSEILLVQYWGECITQLTELIKSIKFIECSFGKHTLLSYTSFSLFPENLYRGWQKKSRLFSTVQLKNSKVKCLNSYLSVWIISQLANGKARSWIGVNATFPFCQALLSEQSKATWSSYFHPEQNLPTCFLSLLVSCHSLPDRKQKDPTNTRLSQPLSITKHHP